MVIANGLKNCDADFEKKGYIMKKRILKFILTAALLCGVIGVIPSTQALAKSKYTKISDIKIDCSKKGNVPIFKDGSHGYKLRSNKAKYNKAYVQPMMKFDLKLKNLPEGANVDISVGKGYLEGGERHYFRNTDGNFTTPGPSLMFDGEQTSANDCPYGWCKVKKKSDTTYTFYIKDAGINLEKYKKSEASNSYSAYPDRAIYEADYRKAYTMYEVIITFKDGSKKGYFGIIDVIPVDYQKASGDFIPTVKEDLFDDEIFYYNKKSVKFIEEVGCNSWDGYYIAV